MKRRIIIIAFDGLDPDLVEGGNYANLKQVEHGEVIINVKPLLTPMIWASFLTGKPPSVHGVKGITRWNNRLLHKLDPFRVYTRSVTYRRLHGLMRVERVLERIGLRRLTHASDYANVPTIFDWAGKYVALGVPTWNQDPEDFKLGKLTFKALRHPKIAWKLKARAFRYISSRKERLLKALGGDWRLFMVYFHATDVIQHVLWWNGDSIRRLYRVCDEVVGEVKGRIDDALILIISDHGMEKGIHRALGFYSASENLGLDIPKITDFYSLICGVLGAPNEGDVESVKRHLRFLGYLNS